LDTENIREQTDFKNDARTSDGHFDEELKPLLLMGIGLEMERRLDKDRQGDAKAERFYFLK
jgi:hypothetical protein